MSYVSDAQSVHIVHIDNRIKMNYSAHIYIANYYTITSYIMTYLHVT